MLILLVGAVGISSSSINPRILLTQINRKVVLLLLGLLLNHSSTIHPAPSASIYLRYLNEGGFLGR